MNIGEGILIRLNYLLVIINGLSYEVTIDRRQLASFNFCKINRFPNPKPNPFKLFLDIYRLSLHKSEKKVFKKIKSDKTDPGRIQALFLFIFIHLCTLLLRSQCLYDYSISKHTEYNGKNSLYYQKRNVKIKES
jgi:hypothetical protein